MTETTAFIRAFRDSIPYIHAFRERTFVVTFSGQLIEDGALPTLSRDLLLLHSLGIRLVLVHGAGPQIASALAARGIAIRHHGDERITDEEAMAAVMEANGRVRLEIESRLSMGLSNQPLPGQRIRIVSGNFVTARPRGVVDGIDYGHTGRVRRIDADGIRTCLDAGNIVLLSAIGCSPVGESFDLTASEVSTMTAIALKADKIIFLDDAALTLPGQMHWIEARHLLETDAAIDAAIDAAGRRLLETAIACCRRGVRRAHIVDRRIDGGLLTELFTRDGIGTLISGDDYEGIRNARLEDIGGLLDLIRPLEEAGILLPRTHESVELDIDDYTVAERDGAIIACAALHPHGEVAELACLAVHPDYRRQRLGERLLETIEERARTLGCRRIFVLTTQAMHWFTERGFRPGRADELPEARRRTTDAGRGSRVFVRELVPDDARTERGGRPPRAARSGRETPRGQTPARPSAGPEQ